MKRLVWDWWVDN